jgi:hypothetical protein
LSRREQLLLILLNLGREGGWYVLDDDGSRVAALEFLGIPDQFWTRYRLRALTDPPRVVTVLRRTRLTLESRPVPHYRTSHGWTSFDGTDLPDTISVRSEGGSTSFDPSVRRLARLIGWWFGYT